MPLRVLAMMLLLELALRVAHGFPVASADPVGLVVTRAWTRATPPGSRTAAGFLTIEGGGNEDRLMSVSSSRAGRVEIHGMSSEGGVMKMWQVKDGLIVSKAGSLSLAPGGTHLMFFEVDKPFVTGERIPVILRFAKAGERSVELEVLPLGSKGPTSRPAEGKP